MSDTYTPSRQSVWKIVAITTFIQSMISYAALAPSVLVEQAGPDLSIPHEYIGWYASLMYFAAVFSSGASGAFIQKLRGPMRVSQLSLLLCGAGVLLMVAGEIWLMPLAALVVGIGYGPVTPASSLILAHYTPPHLRGLVYSIKQTGVPMGGVLVGFTLPVIMENVGWAYAASWVWACLLATALCLIPARKTIDQALCATSHSKNQQAQEKGLKIILNDRNLLLMAAASFTFSAMQVSLSVFLVTYLTTELSYSVYTAGITLSFCQICGVTGRIFFGWLADQWGNARTVQIFIALLTSLIAGVASFVSPDWPYWAVFILLMFFGALSLGWNGVYLAEVARLAPKGTEGLVTGAALAFTFAGVVFGPPLFGGIVQWQGYSLAFQVMAGLVFTGACLVIKVQKKS